MDEYDEGSIARQGPDDSGPHDSGPDDSGPHDSGPDDSVSEESAPEGSVPEDSVSGGLVSGGLVSEGSTSGGLLPGSPASTGQEPGSVPEADAYRPALTGIAALSPRYQIVAALAVALVGVAACVHLGMVFLHVAPANTVTKQHGRAIDEWIYPEFEQNWKLFAPNPLQQNIDVQVRAQVRTADGTTSETGWYDLSALDGEAIDGNLLPSHTQQNELRRAWDFYTATHDNENRPAALRGALSESYLRRVVVLRLDRERAGGEGAVVERVQVRSRTTNVRPPKWSEEQVSDTPILRELPWWSVPEGDLKDARTEASAR